MNRSPSPLPVLTPAQQQALHELLARPALQKLFAALDGDGEEIRVVGGAVRNALLGAEVADIDVAATAEPKIVAARAEKAGLRVVPTGIEHGTLTLLTEGTHFEVTTLREDVETDGRRAKVKFGRDFRADALRRDFTINALSLDGRGQLHDYVEGIGDLAARRVRFIGVAHERIAEDFLRILRFFRFSAAYGAGPLDAEGFAACVARRAGLETLSRERVGAETLKLLAARRAPVVVDAMSKSGLLAYLRVAPWPARLARLFAAARGVDSLLALAALALHVEDDAEQLGGGLRLSNAQKKRLMLMGKVAAQWHGADRAPAPAQLREMLFLHGAQAARDGLALVLAASRAAPDDETFAEADAFLRDTPTPKEPFAAADLLNRGVARGAALGATLKRLQALWIRAGFPSDPRQVADLIDTACADLSEDSRWTRPRH